MGSNMTQAQKLQGALQIMNAIDPKGSVTAEHDEIWIGHGDRFHTERLDEGAIRDLRKFDFTWDEDVGAWHTFV